MTHAHTGEDDIAYYAADIGFTHVLDASTTLNQTSDAEGPLTPGRYLIQVAEQSASSVVTWVFFGAFRKGEPLAGLTTGAGRQRIPLREAGVIAVETTVLKGYNDRIAVLTSTGTSRVFVTQVSRQG